MGFPIVVCSENLVEAGEYSKLRPEFIAYEPPELIGGNVSVTSSAFMVIIKYNIS